jgi:predicted  nucleic acid-binding Zn-ribbon protein
VSTLLGTIIAALIAFASAIYTTSQSTKAKRVTTAQTNEAVDRESQRKTQLRMLELLQGEVETLNNRIVDLRNRLNKAEDFADNEREKRRDLEEKIEQMLDQVQRLRSIIEQIPGAKDNRELARIFKGFPAVEPHDE